MFKPTVTKRKTKVVRGYPVQKNSGNLEAKDLEVPITRQEETAQQLMKTL